MSCSRQRLLFGQHIGGALLRHAASESIFLCCLITLALSYGNAIDFSEHGSG